MTENDSATTASDSTAKVADPAQEADAPKYRGDSIVSGVSLLIKAALVLVSVGLVAHGLTLQPETSVHQIYQLNLITSGIILFAVVGVWGAIDEVAKRL